MTPMTRTVETKASRTQTAVVALLNEHAADPDGLPTTIRFLFYELEQRGLAQKPKREDQRRNRRRSLGWPPGAQDITDAVTQLRNEGIIPWDWLADMERSVTEWHHAPTVADYLRARLTEATINPWEPELPPLVLTESAGMALALRNVAADYVCPIAGTKGQTAGFLRTAIAPLLAANPRRVLYLGDLDRSGLDIENNSRRVLEAGADCVLDWTRIGLTPDQAASIKPIWKVDGRDGAGHDAWEVESLGQAAVVALVRSELDRRLPEPLARVREREAAERQGLEMALSNLGGSDD